MSEIFHLSAQVSFPHHSFSLRKQKNPSKFHQNKIIQKKFVCFIFFSFFLTEVEFLYKPETAVVIKITAVVLQLQLKPHGIKYLIFSLWWFFLSLASLSASHEERKPMFQAAHLLVLKLSLCWMVMGSVTSSIQHFCGENGTWPP